MRKGKSMTLRQFEVWCCDRAIDGMWSMEDAIFCTNLLGMLQELPFWERRKVWNQVSLRVMTAVVGPVNCQIEEARKACIEEEMRYV